MSQFVDIGDGTRAKRMRIKGARFLQEVEGNEVQATRERTRLSK